MTQFRDFDPGPGYPSAAHGRNQSLATGLDPSASHSKKGVTQSRKDAKDSRALFLCAFATLREKKECRSHRRPPSPSTRSQRSRPRIESASMPVMGFDRRNSEGIGLSGEPCDNLAASTGGKRLAADDLHDLSAGYRARVPAAQAPGSISEL